MASRARPPSEATLKQVMGQMGSKLWDRWDKGKLFLRKSM
ncbi:hypothetical protein CCACVL1_09542 [Corchorus capsularis]|uniref:Uncharacterized protein n=1 Tax=Corchorus capsularis TaxID=210143 RepID=A0A1R3IVM1_COCAP|nr:hypothetical protein CCACVL1_09542 [Corchorus capsularis]